MTKRYSQMLHGRVVKPPDKSYIAYKKMVKLCRRYGVHVAHVQDQESVLRASMGTMPFWRRNSSASGHFTIKRSLGEAPLIIACKYKRANNDDKELYACELLHELSHALLPGHPGSHEEINSGNLGFEGTIARRLRLRGWSKWMHHYYTHEGLWRDQSAEVQDQLIRESAEVAKYWGLLTATDEPTHTPPWDNENRLEEWHKLMVEEHLNMMISSGYDVEYKGRVPDDSPQP